MNQPQNPQGRGVFDPKPTQPSTEENTKQEGGPATDIPSEKKDFKDPFAEQQDEVRSRDSGPRKPLNLGESAAEKTAAALNESPGRNVQAELDEMDKVDPNDLKLAEQLIFKGYAEYDVEIKNLPGNRFTICSTNAEEMAVIDEIIYEMLKNSEQDDGSIDIPQNNVNALRNAIFIAISYRGMNKKELMDEDGSCHLNTIKRAIIRVSELQNQGKIKESTELKKNLKECLIRRGTTVQRLATPIIDFLSSAKYEFDAKMLKIMSSKGLLPKS